MKIIKVVIALFCCLFMMAPDCAWADSNSGGSSNGQGGSKGVIIPARPGGKRPSAPSRTFIEGYYSNNYIELTFPAEVEYMTVSLSAGDIVVWEDVLTVDEPSAQYPEMYGEFTLTVTTDDGRVFECLIDL